MGGNWTTYLEGDFQNTPGLSTYRWRQYFLRYEWHGWEIIGGQTWSLFRPSLKGIQTDGAMFNTLVAEPAYQPGLLGVRRRQIRIQKHLGTWHAAVSFENNHNVLTSLVHDHPRIHWEVTGSFGANQRTGFAGTALVNLTPHLRWVTQTGYLHNEGSEALNILPVAGHGLSTVQGLEAHWTNGWQVYAYAGWVHGSRAPGNRLVDEYTVGLQRIRRWWVGNTEAGLQYSHLERFVWDGRRGQMDYALAVLRYRYPRPR